MASPFPGMDPYLESPAHWSDFHAHFIIALADSINGFLPDDYVARVSEHVMVVTPVSTAPGEKQTRFPDVAVLRDPLMTSASPGGARETVAELAWPSVLLENVHTGDDYTETYIEIQRLPSREIVTVLELLSPTNKYGDGRGIYLQKRREFLAQPMNIVELDLLRAGARLRFGTPLPAGHYYAFITRAENRVRTEACARNVRSPFPVMPIPLRAPDADIHLNLNVPFAAAYRRGRYWKQMDYTKSYPPPPFTGADAEWVEETASAGGKPS